MKKLIGDHILSAIEMANMSQKDAAIALNVSPQALNNYVHNKRTPDVDTLCYIMRYFHMDANVVLNIKQDVNIPILNSAEESKLIREFRSLDEEHKEFAKFVVSKMPKKLTDQ